MKGIIWYWTEQHREAAIEELISLKHKYEYCGIKSIDSRVNKLVARVIFNNGDTWEVVSAGERSRGYKCNISFIDSATSMDLINTIIKPCTIAYPFSAFKYWSV